MGHLFNQSITISEEESHLKVSGKGERTDFGSILTNAEKLHAALEASGKKRALLDLSQVLYRVPHADAFNLLKVFELKLIGFREVKLAIIINPRTEELGEFWVSICCRRGFDFKAFREVKEAENWLLAENS